MPKQPPTRYVPLTTEEIVKLKPLTDAGYKAHRTVTGNNTKYVVRKPRRRNR